MWYISACFYFFFFFYRMRAQWSKSISCVLNFDFQSFPFSGFFSLPGTHTHLAVSGRIFILYNISRTQAYKRRRIENGDDEEGRKINNSHHNNIMLRGKYTFHGPTTLRAHYPSVKRVNFHTPRPNLGKHTRFHRGILTFTRSLNHYIYVQCMCVCVCCVYRFALSL